MLYILGLPIVPSLCARSHAAQELLRIQARTHRVNPLYDSFGQFSGSMRATGTQHNTSHVTCKSLPKTLPEALAKLPANSQPSFKP